MLQLHACMHSLRVYNSKDLVATDTCALEINVGKPVHAQFVNYGVHVHILQALKGIKGNYYCSYIRINVTLMASCLTILSTSARQTYSPLWYVSATEKFSEKLYSPWPTPIRLPTDTLPSSVISEKVLFLVTFHHCAVKAS